MRTKNVAIMVMCMPKGVYERVIGVKRGPRSSKARAAISRGRMGIVFTLEHRANLRRSHLGVPRPDVSRALAGLVRPLEFGEKIAAAHERGDFRGPTSLEFALQMLLESAGLEFEAQTQFGRYVVDFWVTSHGLVFEADGEPWHTWLEQNRPGYTVRRDTYLVQRGIKAVVHLDDRDLWSWRIS